MNTINSAAIINQMRTMAAQATGQSVETSKANATQFQDIFSTALRGVNELDVNANQLKTRYEMGDNDVSIADTVVAGQKANIAFEGALRVRNKLVDAYQAIMNMPI